MTDVPRFDTAPGARPHAFDPVPRPECFEGVLSRRVIAFLIDMAMLVVAMTAIVLFIALFGLVTLGLGWLLFFLVGPIFVVLAIVYFGSTLASPASATLGMRAMDLEMRLWYGTPMYFLLGAVHVIVFWISVSVFTPLILVVGLFNARKRLLHDLICGTVVVNNEARAARLRRS
ncbi:MAG TPA: RDD family protein [Xanthobacteraceae bacterium]|nr:RDD family protein [Xanthobacteraceae bacterium]